MYRGNVPRSPGWICEGTDRSQEKDKIPPSFFQCDAESHPTYFPLSPTPCKVTRGFVQVACQLLQPGCRRTLLFGALVELRWLNEGQDTCIKEECRVVRRVPVRNMDHLGNGQLWHCTSRGVMGMRSDQARRENLCPSCNVVSR